MTTIPSVLFISTTSETPNSIIKLILNEDNPVGITAEDDITAYPWHIDNKYYTADVNLTALNKKTISTEKFADTVEAAIVLFDSNSKSGLEAVESWLPYVEVFSPEIKILLCECCLEETEAVTKRSAQEWCVSKGFELVELKPEVVDDDSELEVDFPETTGVKRIIQALHAHVWPNLTLKASTGPSNRRPAPVQNGEASARSETPNSDEQQRMRTLEASLEELLENDGGFSDLFSQLHEMKARVASLSGDDRKAAAEEVVKAFWKAMGGDEDEVADLDS